MNYVFNTVNPLFITYSLGTIYGIILGIIPIDVVGTGTLLDMINKCIRHIDIDPIYTEQFDLLLSYNHKFRAIRHCGNTIFVVEADLKDCDNELLNYWNGVYLIEAIDCFAIPQINFEREKYTSFNTKEFKTAVEEKDFYHKLLSINDGNTDIFDNIDSDVFSKSRYSMVFQAYKRALIKNVSANSKRKFAISTKTKYPTTKEVFDIRRKLAARWNISLSDE